MLVGSRLFAELSHHAQHCLKRNMIHMASQLGDRAADYERRGLLAHAYAVWFQLWLDLRLRRAAYDGRIIDEPYDVFNAPKEGSGHT